MAAPLRQMQMQRGGKCKPTGNGSTSGGLSVGGRMAGRPKRGAGCRSRFSRRQRGSHQLQNVSMRAAMMTRLPPSQPAFSTRQTLCRRQMTFSQFHK